MRFMVPLLLIAAVAVPEAVFGSPITYQGQLKLSGTPDTGTRDMTFRLYDSLVDGNQIGPDIAKQSVPVQDGLFQVELDFGQGAFEQGQAWLEIEVESSLLHPRQAVTAAPLALHALNVSGGGNGDESPWTVNGDHIHYTQGNVGIGVTDPAFDLHVAGDALLTGGAIVGGNLSVGSVHSQTASHLLFRNANPQSGPRLTYFEPGDVFRLRDADTFWSEMDTRIHGELRAESLEVDEDARIGGTLYMDIVEEEDFPTSPIIPSLVASNPSGGQETQRVSLFSGGQGAISPTIEIDAIRGLTTLTQNILRVPKPEQGGWMTGARTARLQVEGTGTFDGRVSAGSLASQNQLSVAVPLQDIEADVDINAETQFRRGVGLGIFPWSELPGHEFDRPTIYATEVTPDIDIIGMRFEGETEESVYLKATRQPNFKRNLLSIRRPTAEGSEPATARLVVEGSAQIQDDVAMWSDLQVSGEIKPLNGIRFPNGQLVEEVPQPTSTGRFISIIQNNESLTIDLPNGGELLLVCNGPFTPETLSARPLDIGDLGTWAQRSTDGSFSSNNWIGDAPLKTVNEVTKIGDFMLSWGVADNQRVIRVEGAVTAQDGAGLDCLSIHLTITDVMP